MNPGNPEKKLRELLEKENLCTLSTVSTDGKPEAATIQYVFDEDFNLYFETFPSYRKYSNMKENPNVAIVVNEENGPKNVQMEGNVEELEEDQAEEIEEMIRDEHGEGTGYLEDQDIKFFKFNPNWIRILLDPEYPPEYRMIKGEGEERLHGE